MQRVVAPLVGPQGGHRDHATVGLAQPAQPLPPDMGGRRAVLAVPGIIDDQHPGPMRRGDWIGQQQLQPPGVDLLVVPGRLRQEELQPLRCRMLSPNDRLHAGQTGQGLVPLPRQQQPGQIGPKSPPLRQRANSGSNRIA
jgi:hypothetical protein